LIGEAASLGGKGLLVSSRKSLDEPYHVYRFGGIRRWIPGYPLFSKA